MFLIVHTPVLDFILDAVSRWACGVNLRQYARGDLQSIGRRRRCDMTGQVFSSFFMSNFGPTLSFKHFFACLK
jgi:hypothetical protein